MKTSEVLRAASKIPWTQGAWGFEPNEPSCAAGAVCKVAGNNRHAVNKSFEFMSRVLGIWNLAYWNDVSGRTHDEVLAAFEKAAQLAESEGD